MDKIKGQLAGVAALLGVIAAIGGGFVKYGEVMTKLEVLEGASKGIDMSFLAEIKVLEEKVNKLENADTTHSHDVGEHQHEEHSHTVSLINKKEIDLLKVQIEEIKVSTKNPLSN
jgi:hypothetical protein|tara:strand:- start:143 stop:487 length:345 start_codon:yes stop_codon:yes gene_type:complete